MPQNKTQKTIFALLTVLFTVHAYVFYSLYVVNGVTLSMLVQQGGAYMFGRILPLWAVILVEFCCAMLLELLMGSPCSFRLACRNFDPKTTHPVHFESAIICATVGLMCPAMSFLAAWFYYPYAQGFHVLTLLANWLRLVCYNFPFAFFSQLFFIQPLVRTIFKWIFCRKQGK